MRTLLVMAALAFVQPLSAQPASAPEQAISYPTVAAALTALEALDGNGTVVTHSDGWTIVNEPLAAARWSFTPPDHYAYPAVVRRVIKRSPDGNVAVETTSICEAKEPDCSKLLAEFNAMNERVTQAVKASGRRGSTQAAP